MAENQLVMKVGPVDKLLFLIVFGIFGVLQSGNAQLDSLREVVHKMPDDIDKIFAYQDIAMEYLYPAPDICIQYSDTIHLLSEKIDNLQGFCMAYYLKGAAYYVKEDFNKAIEHAETALEFARKNKHVKNESNALSLLGVMYNNLNLHEKALEQQLSSLKLAEREKDTLSIVHAYYNMAIIFFEMDDFATSRKYHQITIDLLEKYSVKDVESYRSLALVYSAISGVIEDDPDEEFVMLQKALHYAKLSDSNYHNHSVYQNLSYYYSKSSQFRKAINHAQRALIIAEELGRSRSITESAIALGDYYLELSQLDSAEYFLKYGERVAKEIDYKRKLENSYLHLTNLYKKKNETEKALEYLSLAYNTKDSVYNEEVTAQIQTNSAKYEFEKNQRIISEQQLEISEATNNRNRIIFIAFAILSIVIGIYQWYLRRQQQRKQATELALAHQQAESSRLRELDELKTNFFTNISHELRTPLTLILSPLADLQEQVRAVPVREKLGIIKSNAQRLLNLVNEIMDLAKVEAGKLELQESKVALQQMVQRIFHSYESLAALRRIDFSLNYELEEKQVLIDRGKLEKILHNLLSNAIKYTGAGGQVSMKVSQKGGQHIFEVRDTGQGIDTQDLSRIFDRFYQVKQGTLQGGTGVGLALSKELAELMQGTLSAQSDLGQGSVFSLLLPLEVVGVLKPEVENQEEGLFIESDNQNPIPETLHLTPTIFAPIAIEGEKARLLIVEDNPEMGKYLVQILSENYQCVLATDGQEALKQLKLSRFDCITSDIMMPNMDGFELREAINQNDKWRQIPFLLLTARHLEEDKVRGFQMGIDDYVTKPFSTRELQARIHNLITNKLERDIYTASEQSAPKEEQLSVDQQFLKQVEQAVLERISDPQFGVEDLAKAVNYSSKQLGRLLKKYTGMSTVNFILEVRLQKAREVLEKRLSATVLEAQLDVGISSTSYFTRKFTERFGKNPSELL